MLNFRRVINITIYHHELHHPNHPTSENWSQNWSHPTHLLGLYALCFARPVSMTYTIWSMHSEVSAIFEATTTFREGFPRPCDPWVQVRRPVADPSRANPHRWHARPGYDWCEPPPCVTSDTPSQSHPHGVKREGCHHQVLRCGFELWSLQRPSSNLFPHLVHGKPPLERCDLAPSTKEQPRNVPEVFSPQKKTGVAPSIPVFLHHHLQNAYENVHLAGPLLGLQSRWHQWKNVADINGVIMNWWLRNSLNKYVKKKD